VRPYKKLTIICAVISVISLSICLCLYYCLDCDGADFWVNVCLAVFGSALLTSLSSFVSYFHERRATLEGFMYHCKQMLHALNKYQDSMSLEEKMKFYLDYHDLSLLYHNKSNLQKSKLKLQPLVKMTEEISFGKSINEFFKKPPIFKFGPRL